MPPNWQNRTLFHGDNLTLLRARKYCETRFIVARRRDAG